MKHQTLLHRHREQLPDQHTTETTYIKMNSTSNKMEPTKQLTTGHFSADNKIYTVFLSTSLVTIQNSPGDAIKLRGSLRFLFTSQFHNRRCCKSADAANSAQSNKCNNCRSELFRPCLIL